jgi:hypothetical protein
VKNVRLPLFVSLVLVLGLAPFASAAIVADHNSVNASAIPDSAVTTAANLRVHLRRASVGGNISDGLDALQAANARYNRSRWVFYDRGNPGWQAKVDEFTTFVGSNAASYDVLSMKFCFIDPDASFTYYRDAMLALETAHPGKILVWWTIPIETGGNSARRTFNDQVRAYANANNKPLFDIADIESYNAAGAHRVDSSGREIMWDVWTSDGGHLNDAGAQRVASAWWWLMARLAGWNPGGTPAITIDDASTTEGHTGTKTLTFRVRLSSASTSPVTVAWGTSNGNAPSELGPHQITTRYIGMNFWEPNDNVRWAYFASVGRTGRYGRGTAFDAEDYSIIDERGDPTVDFYLTLFDTNYGMLGTHGGTYSISFNGQATVKCYANASIYDLVADVTTTYDAATNKSTGTLSLPQDVTHPVLVFADTKRTSTASTNTGVANLRVMRPSAPNATTSLPETANFTPQLLEVARKFNAIREMSNIEAGGNDWEVEWSQRIKPFERQGMVASDGRSYGSGADAWVRPTHNRGQSYEWRILLANESDTDLHVNVPVCASDDYLTKLAQLLRYGSDGNNPYTSSQASPVYPPLEAGRKVYIELGNELWNWGSPYWYGANWLHNTAKATGAAHPIHFDDPGLALDENTLASRWQAYRTVQLSNLFRAVWGDANMHTVVRPLVEWQQQAGHAQHALMFLHQYYNNGDGVSYVATPHPVSYYIWGAGVSFYCGPSDQSSVESIFGSWDVNAWARTGVEIDLAWAKTLGLAYFLYEGGPAFGDSAAGSVIFNALLDDRIRQKTIEIHNVLEDYGWDGGSFYSVNGFDESAGGYGASWEYVPNIWDIDLRPKMQALDELNNTSIKRPVVYGNATGAAGFLAAAYTENTNWVSELHDKTAASVYFGRVESWDPSGLGYLVRSASAGNYRLRVQYSGGPTTVQVIANGTIAGTFTLPAAAGATWSSDIVVGLGAGQNGVRLRNLGSDITLNRVIVQP